MQAMNRIWCAVIEALLYLYTVNDASITPSPSASSCQETSHSRIECFSSVPEDLDSVSYNLCSSSFQKILEDMMNENCSLQEIKLDENELGLLHHKEGTKMDFSDVQLAYCPDNNPTGKEISGLKQACKA